MFTISIRYKHYILESIMIYYLQHKLNILTTLPSTFDYVIISTVLSII